MANVSAHFIGWQETGIPAAPVMPLFNLFGGESHGSTVTLPGLAIRGVRPPTFTLKGREVRVTVIVSAARVLVSDMFTGAVQNVALTDLVQR